MKRFKTIFIFLCLFSLFTILGYADSIEDNLLIRLNGLTITKKISIFLNDEVKKIANNYGSAEENDIKQVITLYDNLINYLETEMKNDPSSNIYQENLNHFIRTWEKWDQYSKKDDGKNQQSSLVLSGEKQKVKTNSNELNMVNSKVISPNMDTAPPPNVHILPAPVQLAPPSGSTFSRFPRTTELVWDIVPGAASYTIEIDCFHSCQVGAWCTDIGKYWRLQPGLSQTTYTFNWVGAQPGRWRAMGDRIRRETWY